MDNTFDVVKKLVKERGLLITADILEHSDSQRLKRWMTTGHIPLPQIAGIRAILKNKGEL